ncbi:MAG: alanine racemase, partial [Alistipes sp.]|nr:alanine racemase [Alistipes sp.]
MRYRLSDIARMCGGELRGRDCWVGDIVTDSRRCAFGAGAMFVAMRGVNHDSHDYIADMYRIGIRAFMVERISLEAEDAGYVCVDNALEALQRLAAAHRASFKGVVVGITGSNGKTIVKEWTARALPTSVKLIASPMSYNSQLGVALSLLMIEGDEDVALIEAGISEVGEMERLERMIKPDVVVMTSIGDAHQANFATLEHKVREKLMLAHQARRVVFHSDYSEVEKVIAELQLPFVDAARREVEDQPLHNEAKRVNRQLVKALCEELGYDCMLPVNFDVAMRQEVKEGVYGSKIINDSYNSDINSLALSLDMLRSVSLGGRTLVIMSDILQSGMSDGELYKRVSQLIKRADVDVLIGVGERIKAHRTLFECETRFYDTTEELMRSLTHEDIEDRTILLKGNRRSRFETLCHQLERRSHTTTLEINLDAMTHNVGYFRRFLPMNHRLVAMVKAHSYGAGDVEVAQLMQRLGISYLAVAFADEGIVLREKGITM